MLAGYARAIAVSGRAATVSVLFPMGSLSGQVIADGKSATQSAGGFGDPMLQFGLNLVGPKAMKSIPDVLRYEPGFSIDVIGSLAVPIGEYNNAQSLNIGQNRWYGRIGTPIVWQLGSWAPERRTTLEFLPAVWLFGPNNDFVGKTMTTDALFQLEGHLTHNFAKGFWASLDAAWYTRREVHHRRGPRLEAEQRRPLDHGWVPAQRQRPAHRGLRGDHQRQRPERPPPESVPRDADLRVASAG